MGCDTLVYILAVLGCSFLILMGAATVVLQQRDDARALVKHYRRQLNRLQEPCEQKWSNYL